MLQMKYPYQRISFYFCLSPSIYLSILGSSSYLPTYFSYLPIHRRREKVALPGNYVKHNLLHGKRRQNPDHTECAQAMDRKQ